MTTMLKSRRSELTYFPEFVVETLSCVVPPELSCLAAGTGGCEWNRNPKFERNPKFVLACLNVQVIEPVSAASMRARAAAPGVNRSWNVSSDLAPRPPPKDQAHPPAATPQETGKLAAPRVARPVLRRRRLETVGRPARPQG